MTHPGIVERLLTAPVTKRSIGLVIARNRSLSPAAIALLAVLRAHLAEHDNYTPKLR